MKLRVKSINLSAGRPIAFLHEKDAEKIKAYPGSRVRIRTNGHSCLAIVDETKDMFKPGFIVLSEEALQILPKAKGRIVEVNFAEHPQSSMIIQKKIVSKKYSEQDLKTIVSDIVNNALTDAEISYFVSDVHRNNLSLEETVYLTKAIAATGKMLKWPYRKVADKHSIGGIPGNRTTPIVVSICAAAGIIMPKTSSRAITSAAGTADVIESIARVDFSSDELQKIVRKTGACLAWGGALGLAPADDKIIKVEKMINIDSEAQLVASILAKKLAMGSTHILIDIPFGVGAKVSKARAKKLARKFRAMGKKLKLYIKTVLTEGNHPIGNGIGPILEIRDVLAVLRQENHSKDLENKSVFLAGTILEMMGKAKTGMGQKKAREILKSGEALKKFKEIITAQKGSFNNLPRAKYTKDIKAKQSGQIITMENRDINYICRLAGSPEDKTAGMYLVHHVGDSVKKGDVIFTIHSESREKMTHALNALEKITPIKIR
ncbi:MAG: AMP phosphorylase [Nanoarchaeota archaeon]